MRIHKYEDTNVDLGLFLLALARATLPADHLATNFRNFLQLKNV